MSVTASHPLVRWLAPVGIVLAILAGGGIVEAVRSAAPSSLPARSPASLIADVATANVVSASGTIAERADLGLPALPGNLGDETTNNFASLITGSHTLRAWFDGPTRVRVALLGGLSESDVIRNGSDLWIWSSRDNTASHGRLPATPSGKAPHTTLPVPSASGQPGLGPLPRTPQEAANAIVKALGPSTSVTVGAPVSVAGRSAYTLVVAPKAAASLVDSIRVAIDAKQHVPLRVQVYAKHYADPAFEIGFTQISFARPDSSVFAFNPPPGAKVTPLGESGTTSPSPQPQPSTGSAGRPGVNVIGSGWTAVVVAALPTPTISASPSSPRNSGGPGNGGGPNQLQMILGALPTVHGSFGSGRLLETHLMTALILDDGRVMFGAIEPSALIAAASSPAAMQTHK